VGGCIDEKEGINMNVERGRKVCIFTGLHIFLRLDLVWC